MVFPQGFKYRSAEQIAHTDLLLGLFLLFFLLGLLLLRLLLGLVLLFLLLLVLLLGGGSDVVELFDFVAGLGKYLTRTRWRWQRCS